MIGGARPIVLVADDDASLRLLCRVNLELDGYEVREAASAAEVEAALEGAPVALLLLDVHLGQDDGAVLAASLRERHPTLPIVFLTGSVTGRVAPQGVVDGTISKPFTLEELAGVAHRLIPRRAPAP
jgi:DNA-binding NtrC family response regulator